MKIVLAALGLIIGLYMLADGIFVILNGRYLGPEKPGPWSIMFGRFGIDVFRLGPMFIVFGLTWLFFVAGLLSGGIWVYYLGLVISVLSLWYLPFGTLISVVVLAVLLIVGKRSFM